MFQVLKSSFSSLVRFIRGVETTSISIATEHSMSELNLLEEELSNGTFRAAVTAVEGGLVARWKLIDPFLLVYSYGLVFFFILSALCLAIGVLMSLFNSIIVGLLGIPITLLFGRLVVINWRMSLRSTYNHLFAK